MPLLTGSETLTAKFYIEGVYVMGGGGGNGTPALPNNSVQFNSGGNFAGSGNFTYNDANGGTLTVGTINAGNIITANGNLSITNLISNGTITGNVITANVANIVDANIANANIANLTSNVIVANTANIANVNSNVIVANTANLVDLNVTGNANLGDVSNVHIGGGLPGQFLQTDSTGNLVWADAATGNAVPYMMWDVTAGGSGQSFTNANITQYALSEDMSVFLNGVFVKPTDFTISGDTITFTSFLNTGDLIEVASKSAGTGGTSGGTVTRVGGVGSGLGFTLTGNVISDGNLTLTTPTATQLRTNLSLGNVSNINFNGNGSQFLAGNGVWTPVANATYANTAGTANIANTANRVALANVTGAGNIAGINLNGNVNTVLSGAGTWIPQANSNGVAGVAQIIAGNGIALSPTTGLGTVTISATGTVANATYANTAGVANTANVANGLQSTVANAHITGGTSGQMLITDGTGNLSFATPNAGTVTRVQGNGSGLGFTLTGDVTSSGNLTLTTPSAASLTSSMGLGNVATANFNGNASQVLSGAGTWVAQTGGGGGGSTGYFAAFDATGRGVGNAANSLVQFDTQQYDTIGVTYNTTTGIFTLPVGTYRMSTTIGARVQTDSYAASSCFGFVFAANNSPIIPLTSGSGSSATGYGVGRIGCEIVTGAYQPSYHSADVDIIYVVTNPLPMKMVVYPGSSLPFNLSGTSSMTIQKIA